jgi:hypothetical protein
MAFVVQYTGDMGIGIKARPEERKLVSSHAEPSRIKGGCMDLQDLARFETEADQNEPIQNPASFDDPENCCPQGQSAGMDFGAVEDGRRRFFEEIGKLNRDMDERLIGFR